MGTASILHAVTTVLLSAMSETSALPISCWEQQSDWPSCAGPRLPKFRESGSVARRAIRRVLLGGSRSPATGELTLAFTRRHASGRVGAGARVRGKPITPARRVTRVLAVERDRAGQASRMIALGESNRARLAGASSDQPERAGRDPSGVLPAWEPVRRGEPRRLQLRDGGERGGLTAMRSHLTSRAPARLPSWHASGTRRIDPVSPADGEMIHRWLESWTSS
jgi:hypothetical protein